MTQQLTSSIERMITLGFLEKGDEIQITRNSDEVSLRVISKSEYTMYTRGRQSTVEIKPEENQEYFIRTAREKYTNDELEIDDVPELSMGEDGAFVSAWVWVPDPEEDV
jgi:hypothetical protein